VTIGIATTLQLVALNAQCSPAAARERPAFAPVAGLFDTVIGRNC